MATGRREKDIKLLVEKFIKLVDSLNPGERLSIRKVASNEKKARNMPAKLPKAKASKSRDPKTKSARGKSST